MRKIPQSVKVCLWSYDTDKINLSSPEDRFRIILNILNRGSKEAVEWLWSNFSKEEIRTGIADSIASEWNRKSISFWTHVYDAKPTKMSRFVKS